MKRTALTALTLAMALAASFAVAQPGPGGPGRGPNGPGLMAPGNGMIEFLGLDDAQLEAWTAYHEQFRTTVEPIHDAMQDLHVKLREALDAEAPDASVIGQLLIDTQALRDQVFAAREALDENLKSILTADQLLRFEAFRAAQAHMGRGPGGPGGGPGKGLGAGKGPGSGAGNGPCSGPGN